MNKKGKRLKFKQKREYDQILKRGNEVKAVMLPSMHNLHQGTRWEPC
jgi:hypothetical protein